MSHIILNKKSFTSVLLWSFVGLLLLIACSDTQDKPITYAYSYSWGEEGDAEGQLLHPIGIAIYEGMVYVSDAGNHRIQVFDKQGTFIRSFGKKGTKRGQLNRPMHLAFSGDTLYVPEYLNDRIQLFTPNGKPLTIFGSSGTGEGGFDAPGGVSVDDRTGLVLVADFYNHLIQGFERDGNFLEQFGTGEYGSEPGAFTYPTDVAHMGDGSGNFVVADAYNNRIQKLSRNGEVMWMIPDTTTNSGSAHGLFDVATAVATDDERVYAVDFENHRIEVFTNSGQFVTSFGKEGSGMGQLQRPTDVAIDKNGTAYVVDFGNNRIQVFNAHIP